MILVKMTVEEYLETLPKVGAAAQHPVAAPELPPGVCLVDPLPVRKRAQAVKKSIKAKPEPKADPAPRGTASAAQRRFVGKRKPVKELAQIPCKICKTLFTPARLNSVLCPSKECRREYHRQECKDYMRRKAAKGKAPAAAAAASALTPDQKQARLARIKEIKDRVYGRAPITRPTIPASEDVAELDMANREANQE
jgi:hypothetical protein